MQCFFGHVLKAFLYWADFTGEHARTRVSTQTIALLMMIGGGGGGGGN